MISLILGISFSIEALLLFISIFIVLKLIMFNSVSWFLFFFIVILALFCFFVGQLFFCFARKKYEVESIFHIPLLDIRIMKEEEPLKPIIEDRDIVEIEDGIIFFADEEVKEDNSIEE